MKKNASLLAVPLIGILGVLAGGQVAWAAACTASDGSKYICPLEYHGGPFLETFEIYPLYYGEWTESEIDTWQTYLVNLAAYMSGKNAPASMQPVMKQYGVDQVTVAAAKRASPNAEPGSQPLSKQSLLNIITAGQSTRILPAFGPRTLIVVLPGDGFIVHGGACGDGGGCHPSESTSAFWAVIPKSQGLLVLAHEVFEASADPAKDFFQGWDEAVDNSKSTCSGTPVPLPSFGLTFQIPPPTDNTSGGACTSTGYTELQEKQDYGVTLDQFLSDNATLYSPSNGWSIYILQSYVLANGDVRYNAVWRAGIQFQLLLTKLTREQFDANNTYSSSNGWNLYIFQSYVLANGDVRYNAVWQPGTVSQKLSLGVTYAQYLADYRTFTSTSENLRPYILQAYVTASGVLYNAVFRPGDLNEDGSPLATFDEFESQDDALHPHDWRLYTFQSYVVPSNGQVWVNAIWRPGTHEERWVHGLTYSDYRAKYDQLYPGGWRLYILNTYVLPGGEVHYDAVWRLGTINRPL